MIRLMAGVLLVCGLLPCATLAQNTSAARKKTLTYADSATLKQLFFSGLREKAIENTKLAYEYFDRVVQLDPDNDASLYELAALKKSKNEFNDAQAFLERAVSVNPDNEWYWTSLADCYEKNNSFDKLETVFNELIRIHPDRTDYYFDKANALYYQNKYDKALEIYDKIETITGPTDDLLADRQKIYLKEGKLDIAAEKTRQMMAANPSEIKYYLYLSQLYSSNNLPDKALKVLLDAEKLKPENGLIHLALADIYRDKKNIEASYNELTLAFAAPDLKIEQKIKIIGGYLPQFPDTNAKASALELSRILTVAHPDDSRAFAIYGDMLLQNEKPKEAKLMYQRSIALNGDVYDVQEQLVRIDLGNNDIDDAIKDGENSLSMFPNQAWMNYLVGVAWMQKKDYKKAMDYLKNATSLELQNKELLSQSFSALGDCYHDIKDYKNSDEAYDKALTYNADNVYTLNNYAYYLSLRGEQLSKAARMSKQSNELQPNNASFEDTYAWILFKQKDYAGAKTWIERSLADDKSESSVKLEHYGDILYYLGNIEGAVENWKKAKDNGGKSPVLDRKINERKYVE
ncbi:MAG TPA: tetratricopeptide repeat protein [Mucilaginibacter sp.]|nr:tetratricopeptide repeat protein [Mucilaginibacter sp.]